MMSINNCLHFGNLVKCQPIMNIGFAPSQPFANSCVSKLPNIDIVIKDTLS